MASTKTLFQLPTQPTPTWFENIALGPNGTVLATRLDAPELWSIDPASGAGTRLLSVPGCKSLSGICALGGDVFAVAAGDFEMGGGDKPLGTVPGSWGLWTADLTGAEPVVSEVVGMPEVGFINGLATWDEHTVLVTDSPGGKLYTLDVPSKKYTLAIEDELMAPPTGSPVPYGINGIKVLRTPEQPYLYWTNTTRAAVYRVPVAATGAACKPTGAIETVARGVVGDDLAVAADGSCYVCASFSNSIVRVAGVGGEATTVAGDPGTLEIGGPTACVFSPGEDVLYVSTAGANAAPVDGKTEPAKVVEVKMP